MGYARRPSQEQKHGRTGRCLEYLCTFLFSASPRLFLVGTRPEGRTWPGGWGAAIFLVNQRPPSHPKEEQSMGRCRMQECSRCRHCQDRSCLPFPYLAAPWTMGLDGLEKAGVGGPKWADTGSSRGRELGVHSTASGQALWDCAGWGSQTTRTFPRKRGWLVLDRGTRCASHPAPRARGPAPHALPPSWSPLTECASTATHSHGKREGTSSTGLSNTPASC